LASLRLYKPKPRELFLVFLICIFPTHLWSIIGYLRELPSYLLRLNAWDIVSIFSYAQVIILLDSLLLTIIASVLTILLPRTWIQNRFTSQAALIALPISLWIVFIHYQNFLLGKLPLAEQQFPLAWSISLICILIALSALLYHFSQFEIALTKLIDNIKVLSSLYLILDLGCLIVLVIRFIGLVL
jgi:hypothetical protein